jgi:AAA domain
MNVSNDQNLDLSGLSFADFAVSAGDAKVGYIKLLTYGVSGSGKTTLLSTMPDPLVVLLTEKHGDMTIKRVNPKATIVHIEDKIDSRGRVKKAKDVLTDAIEDLATKEHPFISVALDSLTDLQQIFLFDMKGGKPGADVSLKEWGRLIDQVKHLVMSIRRLNMHAGVICLADEAQDNNQRMIYRPALAGKKLPGAILQYFNLVCFQRKDRDPSSTKRAIHESVFDAGDEYYTKSHPALEPIEAPVVRNWIDKISDYAKSHGEGDMPNASAPVSAISLQREEEAGLRGRLAKNPRLRELFAQLSATEGKQFASLRKYSDDQKLIEVLEKRVKEEEDAKRAKEAKDGEADKPAQEEAKPAQEEASKPAEAKPAESKPAEGKAGKKEAAKKEADKPEPQKGAAPGKEATPA